MMHKNNQTAPKPGRKTAARRNTEILIDESDLDGDDLVRKRSQIAKNDATAPQNTNQFSESKNFIQTIADVSLMMANISQLRAVVGIGKHNEFYATLITLISLSLMSHMTFVVVTVMRSHFQKRHKMAVHRSRRKLETTDNTAGTQKQQGQENQQNQHGQPNPSNTHFEQNPTKQQVQLNQQVNQFQQNQPKQPDQPKKDDQKQGQPNQPKNDEKQTLPKKQDQQTQTIQKRLPNTVKYFFCLEKEATPQYYGDNDFCTCPHCHTDLYLSYICYCLVFLTMVSNIGVTGIGIS